MATFVGLELGFGGLDFDGPDYDWSPVCPDGLPSNIQAHHLVCAVCEVLCGPSC